MNLNRRLSKEELFVVSELTRCRNSVHYFLERYCKVITDKPVPQPFILYPFQKTKCLNSWLKNERQIIVKGRQTGVSTVAAGYALWKMIFEEYFLTLTIAYDQDSAANIIAKMQLMIDNIPKFILPKQTIQNKLSVGFENGSEARALAHGTKKGRSFAPKLLIFDEGAFIEGLEKLYIASSPGLSKTKGQLIVISTPNGYGNWYANTYFGAPENGFVSEKIMWYEMPERDEAWATKERMRLGDRAFAQEYECSFLQSGNTVIEMKDILKQEDDNVRPPEQKLNITDKNFIELNHEEEMWVWEDPLPEAAYIIAADVARGDGLDNSAFSVWKIPSDLSFDVESEAAPAIQVAEFYAKIKTNDYGNLLNIMGERYNNAIVIVENNAIGIATLNTLTELEYPRLYHTDKAAKRVVTLDEGLNVAEDKIPGFTMSMRTRAAVIDSLETLWRIGAITIRSKRLINEAKTWIWKNGRADHSEGNHDDLIMSSAIFAYLYNTSFRLRAKFDRKIEATLDVIHNRNKNSNIKTQFKKSTVRNSNPWILQYGDQNKGSEADSWDLKELINNK